jgi:hypothetical protein
MEPRSFEFVLTMPGDSRLVEAVRNLSVHAASYANGDSAAGQTFAQNVVEATEAVIRETGIQDAPLEFRFGADGRSVSVTIAWARNGSRHTREVRQPLTA